MGLFNKLFNKTGNEESEKNIPINDSLKENLKTIKDILKDCDDIVYREFTAGVNQEYSFAIIYVDGLIDKDLISDNVLRNLMIESRVAEPSAKAIKNKLYDIVIEKNLSATEIKEIDSINKVIENVLVGETVLLIEEYKKAIVVSSRGWPTRGITEAQTETVIRGPRDSLNETLKVSTSLVRRRIRDPKLKIKNMQIGVRSKTDVALLYIEDIADKQLVEEVKNRLKKINIDSIIDSSDIEQLIEDKNISPFPQMENTERPDAVAASLYEGRVAILVDNTPFALLIPITIGTILQSSEDYYNRWLLATLVRLVRYAAVFVVLLAPALYIAITSFHPGILPTQLVLYVAASRVDVPFPAFIEAFLMELTLEFLREAGTRLSGPIGATIGIVGGLIIGQAAVDAGIVSTLMVIIVAVTAVASFAIPNYEFASALRVMRFITMVFSAVLGLYGIMLVLILILTHMVNLKSFGVPFLSPYIDISGGRKDLMDTFIRIPSSKAKERPEFTSTDNKDRGAGNIAMRGDKKDD